MASTVDTHQPYLTHTDNLIKARSDSALHPSLLRRTCVIAQQGGKASERADVAHKAHLRACVRLMKPATRTPKSASALRTPEILSARSSCGSLLLSRLASTAFLDLL